MTNPSTSMSTRRPFAQTELFRPSLSYPSYAYDAMLTHAAQRYPENSAVIFKDVDLTYRELESLVNIWSPEWASVVFYAALVLVLIFRPAGLLGRQAVREQ